MKHTPSAPLRRGASVFAFLVGAACAAAQSTAPSPGTARPDASVTGDLKDDETIVLSPFIIDAGEDRGSYRATSTLAGTRVRTDLRDVGSAISVVTEQFLRDTGATDNQSLLQYTTSTEVGGIAGNYSPGGYGAGTDEQGLLLRPNNNNRVRGLDNADNTRDLFQSEIPWDSYNVGRVDLQRGANSMLFGLGSPAGIINTSLNQANYDNGGNIEGRFGKYGSLRGSIDYNRVLLDDELALRFAALKDRAKYQQKPAYNDDQRAYVTVRFDPKFLSRGSAHTQARVRYEQGDIKANRPRSLSPGDRLTPWFTDMQKLTVHPEWAWNFNAADPDPLNSNQAQTGGRFGVTGDSNMRSNGGSFEPWLGPFGNALGGPMVVFNDENSPAQNDIARAPEWTTYNAINSAGARDGAIEAFGFARPMGVSGYSNWARAMQLPGYNTGGYKDLQITDPSVFDFYRNLIDGPNKAEFQDWETYNAAITQTFLNNRIGFEVAYDHQNYNESQLNFANQGLGVDLNTHFIDGTPNPNVGRPFIAFDPNWGNGWNKIKRDQFRVTGFGELRFNEMLDDSKLGRILGRHVVTGLYSRDKRDQEFRDRIRWAFDRGWGRIIGQDQVTGNNHQPNVVVYLGDSLANRSSAAGAHIPRVSATMIPRNTSIHYFDSRYRTGTAPDPADPWEGNWKVGADSEYAVQAENPDNYQGWTDGSGDHPYYQAEVSSIDNGNGNLLVKEAFKDRRVVSSTGFVWQGFLFDGVVVPTIGWREDTAKSYVARAAKGAGNLVDLSDPAWRLPDAPGAVVKGSRTSYSIVVHTPRSISDRLPGHLGVSLFYSDSSNFQPEAQRVDIYGLPISAPEGETRDVGFAISALENRLTLKVTKFKTKALNVSAPVEDIYKIGSTEAWTHQFAAKYRDDYGQDWEWNWGGSPNEYGTPEAAEAAKAEAVAAWYANPAPDVFNQAWGITSASLATPQVYNGVSANAPPNLSATSDAESEGWEYELYFEPIRNWSITANAAHITATRRNLGGSLADWVALRDPVYQGPAGDIRLWWAGSDYTTRDVWNEFLAKYNLLVGSEGTNVPELRPWRFNLVTNYRFAEGRFKDFNIGGGYRWQDRSVIGFHYAADEISYDANQPVYGPREDALDLWMGYERNLSEGVRWRIQLNLRDVFGKNELVPIATQPDGTVAHYRIREGMGWTVTNTFSF